MGNNKWFFNKSCESVTPPWKRKKTTTHSSKFLRRHSRRLL